MSGSLSLLGFSLGKTIAAPSADNERGFWENEALSACNEAILQAAGHRWDSILPIAPEALKALDAQAARQELWRVFDAELGGQSLILIKDPRCCRLLPLWQEIFQARDIQAHYLMTIRNPLEVAASLTKRNGFTATKGLMIWLRHTIEAEQATRGKARTWLSFDTLLQNAQALPLALQRLGLGGMFNADPARIESFLASGLKHHSLGVDERLGRWCRELYQACLQAEVDEAVAIAVFDRVRVEMQAADELYAPEFRVLEQPLRQEIANLTADLAAANAKLSNALGELSALEDAVHRERLTILRPVIRHLVRLGNAIAPLLPLRLTRLAEESIHRLLKLLQPGHPRLGLYEAARRKRLFMAHYAKTQPAAITTAEMNEPASFIFLPVIDWHFRVQRPQHLAMSLARRGHKVIYLAASFFKPDGDRLFRILEQPFENVYVCQLASDGPSLAIYRMLAAPAQQQMLAMGLRQLQQHFGLRNVVNIVQHPFWLRTAERQTGALLIYDCMDFHGGFSNNQHDILREEQRLLAVADQVVVTADMLARKILPRQAVVIRNAAEVDFFSVRPPHLLWDRKRPTVGYFGAIAEWFDTGLVAKMAAAYPDWDFVLIGSISGADMAWVSDFSNIHWLGEQAYVELPAYLYAFDVCIIPFLVTELTLCTNPVKIYEYLAAGKPVVAVNLPEVALLADQVHVAETHDDFLRLLPQAMAESADSALAQRRADWAKGQSWSHRADALVQCVSDASPKVSVVMLCYNNLDFTKACLNSLSLHSGYQNLEIVVVDNGSTDGTPDYLRQYAVGRTDVKLVLNDSNLGFAAGNNAGLAVAGGDYLVVLNNDTYVTPGWIAPLVRHLRRDKSLGLVGPVTNNIGNEARIDIAYADMQQMQDRAWHYTSVHAGELLAVDTIAFFCAAMRRDVFERVGGLDEAFKFGFFEDDDYCRRVRAAGYRIAIAEDCFVHHHLSASFDALGEERKREIFEANKRIYEAKWGPWQPHTYRRR